MPKKQTKKKPRRSAEDAELAQINTARAQLRRVLAAQKSLQALARALRRAHVRAMDDAIGAARVIALEHGLVVEDAKVGAERIARIEALADENHQLRVELQTLRELSATHPATV